MVDNRSVIANEELSSENTFSPDIESQVTGKGNATLNIFKWRLKNGTMQLDKKRLY